jgi:hypothetical protein
MKRVVFGAMASAIVFYVLGSILYGVLTEAWMWARATVLKRLWWKWPGRDSNPHGLSAEGF